MLRGLVVALAALGAGFLVGIAPAARAQDVIRAADTGNFNIERLRPAVNREGIIDVEWADIEANPNEYDAALLFNYAYDPLVLNLRTADGRITRLGPIVAHRLGASLLGSFTFKPWLEVGGEVPLVLFQAGGAAIPNVTLPKLNAVALGDARVFAKFQVLHEEDQLVDLAVIPALTIPTALPQNSYSGEGFFTLVPEVAVSRTLPIGLRVGANLGLRLRPETNVLGLQVTHELTWRVGAAYRIFEDLPVEIGASLNGATSLVRPFKKVNNDPTELLGEVTWDAIPDRLQVFAGAGMGLVAGFGTPDARAFIGVRWSPRDHDRDGDGIKDDVDQCPDVPEDKDGFEDTDGCPDPDNDGDGLLDSDDRCPNVKGQKDLQGCLPGDSDGDGIADKDDKCPTEPEDKDEFEDEDGCPDPDNDSDGVLDKDDKCPYDAEDKDGYADADGCPDPDNDDDGILDGDDKCPDQPGPKENNGCPNAKIIVTKKKVFSLEKIYFETGKASIKSESLGILDEIAKVLNGNPEIGRVRVEGHTDARGGADYNMRLSQSRTETVRTYLIAKGVPAERLEATGYGLTRPVATNDTPEGREKNRRVEFVLIDAAKAAEGAQAPPATPAPPAPTP